MFDSSEKFAVLIHKLSNRTRVKTTELGSQYVFPGVGNIAKPINNIRKPFEWTLKYAKLPHMRIHDLRHSFISMGANIGENMAAMKEAVGHSRISTTEGYTHIMDSSTYRAITNVANAICG
ncbi:MAG: tyrosine-type recombinase/integrase [Alphaproteobacteria bacterium]|nr:tyrosine-type recombinase/integrase [Alphaproteobacteria bacterium]